MGLADFTSAGRLTHKEYLPEKSGDFRTTTKEQWMERLEAAYPLRPDPHDSRSPGTTTNSANIFREQPGLEVALMPLPISFDGVVQRYQHAPRLGARGVLAQAGGWEKTFVK
jgi:hypothetical protein